MSVEQSTGLAEQKQATTPTAWTGFWRLPSITVAGFTLINYLRSGWILLDIVYIWLLYAAFFFEFGGNVAYFYGTVSQGMALLAILSTVIMVQRAMNAKAYLPLSRLHSRSSYVRGLVIATGVLRIPEFVLAMLLGMSYHRFAPSFGIEGANVVNMTAGAIGLLVNTIAISTLTVVFSAPIATRKARIALLAWLAALLYASTSPDSIAHVLKLVGIPLNPIEICYGFGAAGGIDLVGIGALAIVLLYIVGLTLLGEWWMRHRDLILQ